MMTLAPPVARLGQQAHTSAPLHRRDDVGALVLARAVDDPAFQRTAPKAALKHSL